MNELKNHTTKNEEYADDDTEGDHQEAEMKKIETLVN
jgi:hypothetical protein